jgi:hypothetical protein
VTIAAIDGTDAKVAIAFDGANVAAYVCGGDASYATMTRWFLGASDPSQFDGARDGWSIHGTTDPHAEWHGTLTSPDGTIYTWHTGTIADEGSIGLYDVMDDNCRTGAMVWTDSSDHQTHVQGTWCSSVGVLAGRYEQVTPVRPVERVDSTLELLVNLPTGARDLVAQRVVLLPIQ